MFFFGLQCVFRQQAQAKVYSILYIKNELLQKYCWVQAGGVQKFLLPQKNQILRRAYKVRPVFDALWANQLFFSLQK